RSHARARGAARPGATSIPARAASPRSADWRFASVGPAMNDEQRHFTFHTFQREPTPTRVMEFSEFLLTVDATLVLHPACSVRWLGFAKYTPKMAVRCARKLPWRDSEPRRMSE